MAGILRTVDIIARLCLPQLSGLHDFAIIPDGPVTAGGSDGRDAASRHAADAPEAFESVGIPVGSGRPATISRRRTRSIETGGGFMVQGNFGVNQTVRPVLGLCAVMTLLVAAVPATARADGPQSGAQPAAVQSGDHAEHAHDGHTADEEHAAGHDDHGPKLGSLLPPFAVVPFSLLLLSIAVFPLANPHWWEHNSNKGIIAGVLGVPVAAYLASFGGSGIHAMEHAAKEYVSFLLLLGSLFAISGGIYVRGAFRGTPVVNTIFLALGGAVASLIGTTGASMVLIRPLLRANRGRSRVAHVVVFFIFIVSNCGGLLTPLGDPPLFLGFLKGVPFEWTLRLYPQWLLVNGILLAAFFIWDTIAFVMENPLRCQPRWSYRGMWWCSRRAT